MNITLNDVNLGFEIDAKIGLESINIVISFTFVI